MATWHIFYNNSTKLIAWSTSGLVNDDIKTEQANAGLSYLSVEQDNVPSDSEYWVNSSGDGIIEKSVFNPSYSTTRPTIDSVVTVTGLPTGTEVFVDGVSAGTMSDTSLTFTATEPGNYKVNYKKVGYKNFTDVNIVVKRHGE
jgi:hypothetical protein